MFSKVNSIGLLGFNAELVEVEVDLSSGLPRFDLVGLPDSAVSEAKERVRSAIKNSGLSFPISRITVNLAPAEFKKEGPIYDLPILMGILLASGQLKADLSDCAFVGEISLNGEIRRINGVLPMAIKAEHSGIAKIFVPAENAVEAALIPGISVYPVGCLSELLKHFRGESKIIPLYSAEFEPERLRELQHMRPNVGKKEEVDFADVIGQQAAKRALEVAAAGSHNILMMGSPGAGKSMLAKRLPTILPDMAFEEIISTTSVYSVAGKLTNEIPIITNRPFRSPHHTASIPAVTGGGQKAAPGEIPLAHSGVLFLDEFPMFPRAVLETLRQPLEDRIITITRNACTATYPANIMLVAAMNPCPCGYLSDPLKKCTCTEHERQKYFSKISGPLIDRIDITVRVDPVDCKQIIDVQVDTQANANTGVHVDTKPIGEEQPQKNFAPETSFQIRARVNKAREIQLTRFKGLGITCNAQMSTAQVRQFCTLSDGAKQLLLSAYKNLGFSARANDKILKTARTIADLDASETITESHIAEAIQYRSVDRVVG